MQQPKGNHDHRLYGLDTLRAIAISIVLMENYRVVSDINFFGFMSEQGWAGVVLFFVLSGYLIGNQIFSAFVKEQDFSLTLFYIRRLLRTLPVYYAVLALYFIFPTALNNTDATPLWKLLTFTQNLDMNVHSTFKHSWSLCVEEQFYLVLPLAAMIIAYSKKSLTLGWLVLVVATLLVIFMRAYNWYAHGQASISGQSFMDHIYHSTFTRFDELLLGVAIAMLKNFYPSTFERVQQKGNLLLATGLISVGIMFYVFQNYLRIPGYGFSLWVTTFGYTLLAIAFGILVLAALSPNSLLHRIRIPGATSIALWSYAIYLIHPIIFHVIKAPLTQYGFDVNTGLSVAIFMLTTVFCGWILYVIVETPFMKLRARYFPTNFDAAQKQHVLGNS